MMLTGYQELNPECGTKPIMNRFKQIFWLNKSVIIKVTKLKLQLRPFLFSFSITYLTISHIRVERCFNEQVNKVFTSREAWMLQTLHCFLKNAFQTEA